MKLEVNISKTNFFVILGAVLILAGVIAGYAYSATGTGGNPPVFGHSVDEVDWSNPIPGDFLLGGVRQWVITNRNTGIGDGQDDYIHIAPKRVDGTGWDWGNGFVLKPDGDLCSKASGKCLSQIGTGGGGASLPSGAIVMFDTACPEGWTRFAALDGKTIRGAATYGGTGGADEHQHQLPRHNVRGGGDAGSLAGDYSYMASSWPPYLEVVWCKKN